MDLATEYVECVKQLVVKIRENTGISRLIKKHVKLKDSFVVNHLIFHNHSELFDDLSILMHENKTFLIKLKECLLIMGMIAA